MLVLETVLVMETCAYIREYTVYVLQLDGRGVHRSPLEVVPMPTDQPT